MLSMQFHAERREDDPSLAPILDLIAPSRPHGQGATTFVRFVGKFTSNLPLLCGDRWIYVDRLLVIPEGDRQVGEITHSHGLRMQTSAGDFAEWHAALSAEELPFREGDLVGIFGEKISRRTANANMLGVVSMRAAIVGSLDKATEHTGACVAYMGRVPVRACGPVIAGQALVPSGQHDGTAVAVPAPGNMCVIQMLQLTLFWIY